MYRYRPDLKDSLRANFRAGSQQKLIAVLRTPEQLNEASKIVNKAQVVRDRVVADHHARFDVRVKHALFQVRDEWTRPSQHLRPRHLIYDRVNPNDLRIEAERRVRRRHEDNLVRVHATKVRMLAKLAGVPERDVHENAPRIDRRPQVRSQAEPQQQRRVPNVTQAFQRARTRD